MSEAAAAAPSTVGATSAAAGETGANSGNSPNQVQTQGAKTQGAAEGSAPKTEAEEFEEIKLGSASAKVPKAFAKTIKDLERGFHSKAQEAAQAREILQLAQSAKDNHEIADALFERFGIDADQYSQARLAKKLEHELMDPHERKAKDLERELDQYKKQEKEAKDRAEQEKYQAAERKADQELRTSIFEAWKSSGLPPEPEFGGWIAAEMARADAQGRDLSAAEAAATVKNKFDALIKRVATQLGPEQLQTYLGDEPLTKWREFDVKRITSKAPHAGSSHDKRPGHSPASNPNKSGGKKALTEAEYREHFARLARGE